MSRLQCLGDQHLGVHSLPIDDQETVWASIVDLAVNEGVDAVLHAGDLFELPQPAPAVLAAFRRPYRRLREAGIPMLLIRGNGTHDGAARDVDALDVLREYPGLTVSTRPAVYAVGGIAVCTLPWVSPGRLLAQAPEADRDMVNAVVARMLVDIASDLEERARRDHPGLPVVLLGHWSVSGASLPTGLPVDQLRDPILEIADLEALGFDALVMGHIHKAQHLVGNSDGDRAFYVGSPQPLNHGEERADHGVWLLEPTVGDATFLPLVSREFVTFDMDHAGITLVPAGAVVRVRYTATEQQAREIDQARIRADLLEQGASRVTFEPQIIRAARARAETLHADLGPLDALRLYCEAQAVEPLLVERMVERLRGWVEA